MKNTFACKTFASRTFASGMFRGVGAVIVVIGQEFCLSAADSGKIFSAQAIGSKALGLLATDGKVVSLVAADEVCK